MNLNEVFAQDNQALVKINICGLFPKEGVKDMDNLGHVASA